MFGQPVAGNPTQYMMEKAFVQAGLDWRYLTLEVVRDDLESAVQGMRAMGFRGANLTIPHKVAVIPHLDGLAKSADLMGAVNCIVRRNGSLIGENTDGKGFLQSLQTITNPSGKRFVVLGAGGAARAIAVEVGLAGAAAIDIVNRSPERGEDLVELLNERVNVPSTYIRWEGDYSVPDDTDVLINGTSIGLNQPDARIPLAVPSLRENLVVADVVFNPPQTRLLADAATRKCQTLDGLGMLVNQAVIAFSLWTGIDPDASVMRDALEEFLGI